MAKAPIPKAKAPKKQREPESFKADFREPTMTPDRGADIARAAALHASADRSDPFAHGRITTHMRRGMALPSDVIADAQAKLAARGRATGADA